MTFNQEVGVHIPMAARRKAGNTVPDTTDKNENENDDLLLGGHSETVTEEENEKIESDKAADNDNRLGGFEEQPRDPEKRDPFAHDPADGQARSDVTNGDPDVSGSPHGRTTVEELIITNSLQTDEQGRMVGVYLDQVERADRELLQKRVQEAQERDDVPVVRVVQATVPNSGIPDLQLPTFSSDRRDKPEFGD